MDKLTSKPLMPHIHYVGSGYSGHWEVNHNTNG